MMQLISLIRRERKIHLLLMKVEEEEVSAHGRWSENLPQCTEVPSVSTLEAELAREMGIKLPIKPADVNAKTWAYIEAKLSEEGCSSDNWDLLLE